MVEVGDVLSRHPTGHLVRRQRRKAEMDTIPCKNTRGKKSFETKASIMRLVSGRRKRSWLLIEEILKNRGNSGLHRCRMSCRLCLPIIPLQLLNEKVQFYHPFSRYMLLTLYLGL